MRRPLLLLGLAACLLACGLAVPAPAPTPSRPAGSTSAAPPITAAPLAGLTLPPELPRFATWSLPAAAQLPLEAAPAGALPALPALANPGDLFPLAAAERAMLAATGFVVLPDAYGSLEEVYADAAADQRPVLITADLLLATSAAAIAATWSAVAPQLAADLEALLTTLQPIAVVHWQAATGDAATAAAAQVAYLSVAATLLTLSPAVPPEIAPQVADELTLIRRADGVFRSPIQAVETDYAPFGGQPPLTQALLWLSRLDFRLDGAPALVRRQARQVLFLWAALEESGNRSRWERLDVALGYFWGEPAGLTMADVDVIARAVVDDVGPTLSDAQLDQFIATARQFATRIRFLPFTGEQQSLLGAVGEALTFNRVGVYVEADDLIPFTGLDTDVGLVRAVDHPLDRAAALGSARALALLQGAGETRYEGYEGQLAAVATRLAALDEGAWTRTVPDAWAYATGTLLLPAAPAAPPFMQSDAWVDRQLWAWLGAQLLPALGAAPSGSPFAGAEVAYVEPQPQLYARLAALIGQLRRGVAARGLADEGVGVRLGLWEDALVQLARISVKQLAGVGFTPEEAALLTVLGQRLGAATAPELRGPLAAPGIVPQYRDGGSGLIRYGVLIEALPLYALVTVGEETLVVVGGIWSTTSLSRAADTPLSSAAWAALPPPARGARPVWTNRFIAPAGS